jgi:hypothetical protein
LQAGKENFFNGEGGIVTEQHPNQEIIMKTGDLARDFSLANTDGRFFTLSTVLTQSRGPVVVLFYRGDW